MRELKEKNAEQRHFTRMAIDAPAEVLVKAAEPQQLAGICRDLSAGGMLLETQEAVPSGSLVQVTLRAHYGNTAMLSCEGRVVRSDPIAEKNGVILGLEILEFLD